MSGDTKIQWTATVHPDGTVTPGSTWNPVRGCSRVSEGCRHCYAEGVAARFSGTIMKDGKEVRLPYYGLARRAENGEPRWTGEVQMVPEHLDDPIRWKRPRRIFVNSMSDVFHGKLTYEQIESVFMVMLNAPRHTYQVLTKRAKRMRSFVDKFLNDRGLDVLPSFIWMGVSAEDQPNLDERVPELFATRAAVRFVSAEPLLGPIRFHDDWPLLNWVIVGGESGRGARPFDVRWARSIVDQCAKAGAACFVKQLGARPFDQQPFDDEPVWLDLGDSHGGNIDEWPAGVPRVREFPEAAA